MKCACKKVPGSPFLCACEHAALIATADGPSENIARKRAEEALRMSQATIKMADRALIRMTDGGRVGRGPPDSAKGEVAVDLPTMIGDPDEDDELEDEEEREKARKKREEAMKNIPVKFFHAGDPAKLADAMKLTSAYEKLKAEGVQLTTPLEEFIDINLETAKRDRDEYGHDDFLDAHVEELVEPTEKFSESSGREAWIERFSDLQAQGFLIGQSFEEYFEHVENPLSI